MTALTELNDLVAELKDAIAQCHRYNHADTPNKDVAIILSGVIMDIQKAIIKIHEGDVK